MAFNLNITVTFSNEEIQNTYNSYKNGSINGAELFEILEKWDSTSRPLLKERRVYGDLFLVALSKGDMKTTDLIINNYGRLVDMTVAVSTGLRSNMELSDFKYCLDMMDKIDNLKGENIIFIFNEVMSETMIRRKTYEFGQELARHEKFMNSITKENFYDSWRTQLGKDMILKHADYFYLFTEKYSAITDAIIQIFENDREGLSKIFPNLDVFIF